MPNMNSFVIVVLALVAAAQANVVYRRLKLQNKIVGGEVSEPNSYPYQAYLMMFDANGDRHRCGGSLLTTTKILTAAHCVKDYVSIRVYLGAHDIRNYEATQQRIQALGYTYHGGYDDQTVANDIGIVTLESPAELNQYVQLTTLPTRADVGNTYVGQLATVSGWGVYSDAIGSFSDVLRCVSGPIVSNEDCNKDFDYVAPSQICVDGALLKAACDGDSGGPLVTGANRVQIGIVSYAIAEKCEKGFDGVYTRVTEYLDWIAENGDVQIN